MRALAILFTVFLLAAGCAHAQPSAERRSREEALPDSHHLIDLGETTNTKLD